MPSILAIAVAGTSAAAQGLECDIEPDSVQLTYATGFPGVVSSFGDYFYTDIEGLRYLGLINTQSDIIFERVDLDLRTTPVAARGHLYYRDGDSDIGITAIDGFQLDDDQVVDAAFRPNVLHPIVLGSIGNALYIKGERANNLKVYRLDDPLSPQLTSYTLPGMRDVTQMMIHSSRPRAAALELNSAHIIDTTDALSPVIVQTVDFAADIPSRVGGTVILGDWIYIASEATQRIHVFGLTEDDELVESSSYPFDQSTNPVRLFAGEGRLWLESRYGTHGFSVHPTTGRLEPVHYSPKHFAITSNGWAISAQIETDDYAGIDYTRITGYHIDQPTRPQMLWDGGEGIEDVFLSDNRDLITIEEDGTLTISKLPHGQGPILRSSVDLSYSSSASILTVEKERLYLKVDAALMVIDIRDRSNPVILQGGWLPPMDRAGEMHIDGWNVYIKNTTGTSAFDLRDPGQPTELFRIDHEGYRAATSSPVVEDDRLYIPVIEGDRDGKILIYSLAGSEEPGLLGIVSLNSYTFQIPYFAVHGTVLYARTQGDFSPDVQAFDVSDPARATQVSFLSNSHYPTSMSVNGSRMLVVERDWYGSPEDYYPTYGCYAVYDISDPLQPVFLNRSYDYGTNFDRAFLLDDVALLHGPTPVILRANDQCETCETDLNQDRSLNFLDVSLLIHLYYATDPFADFNGDGRINFFDIAHYIAEHQQGCG